MPPRARISGGLSADDPLRVKYEPNPHVWEEKSLLRQAIHTPQALFRRIVPLRRPFQSLATNRWAANVPYRIRGFMIAKKNSSTSPPTLEQKVQQSISPAQPQLERCSSPAQLEEAVELPSRKLGVQQSSVIPSTALSDGSKLSKELEGQSSDRVVNLPELQKVQVEEIEKREEHDVDSSPSKPKASTKFENSRGSTFFKAVSDTSDGMVIQWMNGINNYPSERVEHGFPPAFESERRIQQEAVLNTHEQNKTAIAQKTENVLDTWPTASQSMRDSCTTKRESVMTTAPTMRESVFSKLSSSTDQTSLTSPRVSIILDANNRSKLGDSRDSSRFSRAAMSNRTSIMSQRSLPLRFRPINSDGSDRSSKGISSQDASPSSASLNQQASQNAAELPVLQQEPQAAPSNQEEKRSFDELDTITIAANSAVLRRRKHRPGTFVERDKGDATSPGSSVREIRESNQDVDEDDAEKENRGFQHKAAGEPNPGCFKEDQLTAGPYNQQAESLPIVESDSSTSPNEYEFDDSSSSITDYSDTSLLNLSEVAGFGPMLQLLLVNIRNDLVHLVMNQLSGTRHHPGSPESNQSSSNQPFSGESHAANPSGQPSTNGKRSADRCPDSPDDRDDGDPEKRRKLNPASKPYSTVRWRLACPFYKHNPQNHQKWKSCRGPGFENVHRVKEHVYRRHALPTPCHRCQQQFNNEAALKEHAQADVPCEKSTVRNETIEGFSKDQEKKLRSRRKQPKQSEEEKWTEMYRILFGDDAEVPRPYCDIDFDPTPLDADKVARLRDCLQHLPEELTQNIKEVLPLSDDEREMLPEVIRKVIDTTISGCLNSIISPTQSSTPGAKGHPSDYGDTVEPEPNGNGNIFRAAVNQRTALTSNSESHVWHPLAKTMVVEDVGNEHFYPVTNIDPSVLFTTTENNQFDCSPFDTNGALVSQGYPNDPTSTVSMSEGWDFSNLICPLPPWEVPSSEIQEATPQLSGAIGGTGIYSILEQLQEIPSSLGNSSSQQGGIPQYHNPQTGPSTTVPSGPCHQFQPPEYSAAGRDNISHHMGTVGDRQMIGNGEQGVGWLNQN